MNKRRCGVYEYVQCNPTTNKTKKQIMPKKNNPYSFEIFYNGQVLIQFVGDMICYFDENQTIDQSWLHCWPWHIFFNLNLISFCIVFFFKRNSNDIFNKRKKGQWKRLPLLTTLLIKFLLMVTLFVSYLKKKYKIQVYHI